MTAEERTLVQYQMVIEGLIKENVTMKKLNKELIAHIFVMQAVALAVGAILWRHFA